MHFLAYLAASCLSGITSCLDGRYLLGLPYSPIENTFGGISCIYLFGRGSSSFLKDEGWKLRGDCKTLEIAENTTSKKIFDYEVWVLARTR